MKTGVRNQLSAALSDYLTDHLPRLRGTSPHTIHSYCDSMVLLLRFLSQHLSKPVTALDLADLAPPAILAFLSYLERERNNGVATRNVRLSAIHAFFRFVAARNPEHLDLAQRILGIPSARHSGRLITWNTMRSTRFSRPLRGPHHKGVGTTPCSRRCSTPAVAFRKSRTYASAICN